MLSIVHREVDTIASSLKRFEQEDSLAFVDVSGRKRIGNPGESDRNADSIFGNDFAPPADCCNVCWRPLTEPPIPTFGSRTILKCGICGVVVHSDCLGISPANFAENNSNNNTIAPVANGASSKSGSASNTREITSLDVSTGAGAGTPVNTEEHVDGCVFSAHSWKCGTCSYWNARGLPFPAAKKRAIHVPEDAQPQESAGLKNATTYSSPSELFRCAICERPSGAMCVGSDGLWVHVACVYYSGLDGPQLQFNCQPVAVQRFLALHRKAGFRCVLCHSSQGFSQRCGFPGCRNRVHAVCALERRVAVPQLVPRVSPVPVNRCGLQRAGTLALKLIACPEHTQSMNWQRIIEHQTSLIERIQFLLAAGGIAAAAAKRNRADDAASAAGVASRPAAGPYSMDSATVAHHDAQSRYPHQWNSAMYRTGERPTSAGGRSKSDAQFPGKGGLTAERKRRLLAPGALGGSAFSLRVPGRSRTGPNAGGSTKRHRSGYNQSDSDFDGGDGVGGAPGPSSEVLYTDDDDLGSSILSGIRARRSGRASVGDMGDARTGASSRLKSSSQVGGRPFSSGGGTTRQYGRAGSGSVTRRRSRAPVNAAGGSRSMDSSDAALDEDISHVGAHIIQKGLRLKWQKYDAYLKRHLISHSLETHGSRRDFLLSVIKNPPLASGTVPLSGNLDVAHLLSVYLIPLLMGKSYYAPVSSCFDAKKNCRSEYESKIVGLVEAIFDRPVRSLRRVLTSILPFFEGTADATAGSSNSWRKSVVGLLYHLGVSRPKMESFSLQSSEIEHGRRAFFALLQSSSHGQEVLRANSPLQGKLKSLEELKESCSSSTLSHLDRRKLIADACQSDIVISEILWFAARYLAALLKSHRTTARKRSFNSQTRPPLTGTNTPLEKEHGSRDLGGDEFLERVASSGSANGGITLTQWMKDGIPGLGEDYDLLLDTAIALAGKLERYPVPVLMAVTPILGVYLERCTYARIEQDARTLAKIEALPRVTVKLALPTSLPEKAEVAFDGRALLQHWKASPECSAQSFFYNERTGPVQLGQQYHHQDSEHAQYSREIEVGSDYWQTRRDIPRKDADTLTAFSGDLVLSVAPIAAADRRSGPISSNRSLNDSKVKLRNLRWPAYVSLKDCHPSLVKKLRNSPRTGALAESTDFVEQQCAYFGSLACEIGVQSSVIQNRILGNLMKEAFLPARYFDVPAVAASFDFAALVANTWGRLTSHLVWGLRDHTDQEFVVANNKASGDTMHTTGLSTDSTAHTGSSPKNQRRNSSSKATQEKAKRAAQKARDAALFEDAPGGIFQFSVIPITKTLHRLNASDASYALVWPYRTASAVKVNTPPFAVCSGARSRCCAICFGSEWDGVNAVLVCAQCRVMVHRTCYCVYDTSLDGETENWLCRRCTDRATHARCILCNTRGGALARADHGNWVHITCAVLLMPETAPTDARYLDRWTLASVERWRWDASCTICSLGASSVTKHSGKEVPPSSLERHTSEAGDETCGAAAVCLDSYPPRQAPHPPHLPALQFASQHRGACVRCAAPSCSRTFHITCAWLAGLQFSVSKIRNSFHNEYWVPERGQGGLFPRLDVSIYCLEHTQIETAMMQIVGPDKKMGTSIIGSMEDLRHPVACRSSCYQRCLRFRRFVNRDLYPHLCVGNTKPHAVPVSRPVGPPPEKESIFLRSDFERRHGVSPIVRCAGTLFDNDNRHFVTPAVTFGPNEECVSWFLSLTPPLKLSSEVPGVPSPEAFLQFPDKYCDAFCAICLTRATSKRGLLHCRRCALSVHRVCYYSERSERVHSNTEAERTDVNETENDEVDFLKKSAGDSDFISLHKAKRANASSPLLPDDEDNVYDERTFTCDVCTSCRQVDDVPCLLCPRRGGALRLVRYGGPGDMADDTSLLVGASDISINSDAIEKTSSENLKNRPRLKQSADVPNSSVASGPLLLDKKCGNVAYAHVECLLHAPGRSTAAGLDQLIHSPLFGRRTCSLCQHRYGVTLPCSEVGCSAFMHPLCARLAGCYLEQRIERSVSDDFSFEETVCRQNNGVPSSPVVSHDEIDFKKRFAVMTVIYCGEHSKKCAPAFGHEQAGIFLHLKSSLETVRTGLADLQARLTAKVLERERFLDLLRLERPLLDKAQARYGCILPGDILNTFTPTRSDTGRLDDVNGAILRGGIPFVPLKTSSSMEIEKNAANVMRSRDWCSMSHEILGQIRQDLENNRFALTKARECNSTELGNSQRLAQQRNSALKIRLSNNDTSNPLNGAGSTTSTTAILPSEVVSKDPLSGVGTRFSIPSRYPVSSTGNNVDRTGTTAGPGSYASRSSYFRSERLPPLPTTAALRDVTVNLTRSLTDIPPFSDASLEELLAAGRVRRLQTPELVQLATLLFPEFSNRRRGRPSAKERLVRMIASGALALYKEVKELQGEDGSSEPSRSELCRALEDAPFWREVVSVAEQCPGRDVQVVLCSLMRAPSEMARKSLETKNEEDANCRVIYDTNFVQQTSSPSKFRATSVKAKDTITKGNDDHGDEKSAVAEKRDLKDDNDIAAAAAAADTSSSYELEDQNGGEVSSAGASDVLGERRSDKRQCSAETGTDSSSLESRQLIESLKSEALDDDEPESNFEESETQESASGDDDRSGALPDGDSSSELQQRVTRRAAAAALKRNRSPDDEDAGDGGDNGDGEDSLESHESSREGSNKKSFRKESNSLSRPSSSPAPNSSTRKSSNNRISGSPRPGKSPRQFSLAFSQFGKSTDTLPAFPFPQDISLATSESIPGEMISNAPVPQRFVPSLDLLPLSLALNWQPADLARFTPRRLDAEQTPPELSPMSGTAPMIWDNGSNNLKQYLLSGVISKQCVFKAKSDKKSFSKTLDAEADKLVFASSLFTFCPAYDRRMSDSSPPLAVVRGLSILDRTKNLLDSHGTPLTLFLFVEAANRKAYEQLYEDVLANRLMPEDIGSSLQKEMVVPSNDDLIWGNMLGANVPSLGDSVLSLFPSHGEEDADPTTEELFNSVLSTLTRYMTGVAGDPDLEAPKPFDFSYEQWNGDRRFEAFAVGQKVRIKKQVQTKPVWLEALVVFFEVMGNAKDFSKGSLAVDPHAFESVDGFTKEVEATKNRRIAVDYRTLVKKGRYLLFYEADKTIGWVTDLRIGTSTVLFEKFNATHLEKLMEVDWKAQLRARLFLRPPSCYICMRELADLSELTTPPVFYTSKRFQANPRPEFLCCRKFSREIDFGRKEIWVLHCVECICRTCANVAREWSSLQRNPIWRCGSCAAASGETTIRLSETVSISPTPVGTGLHRHLFKQKNRKKKALDDDEFVDALSQNSGTQEENDSPEDETETSSKTKKRRLPARKNTVVNCKKRRNVQ